LSQVKKKKFNETESTVKKFGDSAHSIPNFLYVQNYLM